MNIILYNNQSENNKIGKTLVELKNYTGSLKGQSSILSPVFTIKDDLSESDMKANYCYIPDFGRYYFITDITNVRTGLWQFSCSVDVLETYKAEILENTGIISRQENVWNMYLNDSEFRIYQNPNVITKTFPSGFSTQSFVLAVSGG